MIMHVIIINAPYPFICHENSTKDNNYNFQPPLEEKLSIKTIRYNLYHPTHGGSMHNKIIVVVDWRISLPILQKS